MLPQIFNHRHLCHNHLIRIEICVIPRPLIPSIGKETVRLLGKCEGIFSQFNMIKINSLDIATALYKILIFVNLQTINYIFSILRQNPIPRNRKSRQKPFLFYPYKCPSSGRNGDAVCSAVASQNSVSKDKCGSQGFLQLQSHVSFGIG